MSTWDDMHAEAIENLERPDGCDCGIEFIYGGARSKILRASVCHDLGCPGGMPKTAKALERLDRSKSEEALHDLYREAMHLEGYRWISTPPDEVTDEERHCMAGAAKANRYWTAIVRMAARKAGVA